ncbi:MAG: hypothetical protein ABMA64_38015 [Myxococcota bacterium]
MAGSQAILRWEATDPGLVPPQAISPNLVYGRTTALKLERLAQPERQLPSVACRPATTDEYLARADRDAAVIQGRPEAYVRWAYAKARETLSPFAP